jgi:cytochrome c biogenesis protein
MSPRALYDDFIRTFGNVLFAVALFAVWGVLTLVGVVVEQGKDAAFYAATYPAPIARALLRLDFDNVYHSPWYVGIIGLILTSLAVCTFKRVIPARLPPLRPVRVEAIPLHATLHLRGTASEVRARIEAFFTRRGWQIRKRSFGGVEWTFADRHNWARRGVLVAHMGFVIIAAGTTLYWWKGFSGETVVLTGDAVRIPQTGAVLSLRSFRYVIQPTMTKSGLVYQPIDYVSSLVVTGKDGIPRPMTLRVNHPIDIDGTYYYQSSYGFGVRFLVTHDGRPVPALSDQTLLEGQMLAIPGVQRSVEFAQFVPTIDRTTGRPSPDPRVNDPGVILEVFEGNQPLGAALVPMKTWIDLGDGWRIIPQAYRLFSGIQYRYDPGVPLVGIGAFVLLAGLVISFYFLPARLYVRVDDKADGTCTVGMAATTVKGYDIFDGAFRELVERLRAELDAQPPAPALVPAEVTPT